MRSSIIGTPFPRDPGASCSYLDGAGSSCGGREILYVTERCVFRLLEAEGGSKVELIEIAPGIRLQEDVLDLMEFKPVMRNVQLMDSRCFWP